MRWKPLDWFIITYDVSGIRDPAGFQFHTSGIGTIRHLRYDERESGGVGIGRPIGSKRWDEHGRDPI
jgi:hypothetical protein